jgi:hypothetical protein
MWRAHKAAGTKIRLQIIGQKILAHFSPEAEDLRAHWLATTKSLVTGPKNYGHERKSTRTSSVAITYRDRTWQRSPQGIDATLSIWDPRNQLARARASGTPSLSFQPDICGAKRPQPLHHRAGHHRHSPWSGLRFSGLRAGVNRLKKWS